jgi:shikimate dehydrogenase
MGAGALAAGAARLLIHDVEADRQRNLARRLRDAYPSAQIEALNETDVARAAGEADLIANATPLGMRAGDPPPLAPEAIEAIAPRHVVFDAVYNPARTALLAAAERRGARVVPGLGMLARQGARALEIWSGRAPDEALMIDVLRRELKMG